MKTTVSNFLTKLKRRIDYNITDSDTDNLLVDCINDALKLMYQWMFDASKYLDISATTSFKTTINQAYIDLQKARIVGDVTTFTGIVGDKINVTIDGTAYADIAIATPTTITLVAAAINTSVGSTVATVDDDGYLVITSPTTGADSSVIIADGTTTVQTVVGDLFSVAGERTNTALTNMDSLVRITERTNDNPINLMDYHDFIARYVNPTSSTSDIPYDCAIWDNKLYLGPTPSTSTTLIYIDHVSVPAEITTSSTLPYLNKYDSLLLAQARVEWLQFFDGTATGPIVLAQGIVDKLRHDLITASSGSLGKNRQMKSRNDIHEIGPRTPTYVGDIDGFA